MSNAILESSTARPWHSDEGSETSTEHGSMETNVDTGKTEKAEDEYKRCKNENIELKKLLDDTLKENTKLHEEIKAYKTDITILNRNYVEMKDNSEQLTSQMAHVLEAKGGLENVNDEYANRKLAKKFETLYDKKWIELSEWIHEKNKEMNEIESIKTLTEIGKDAYRKCVSLAEEQLRQFLFLDKDEPVPYQKDNPDLFKIRRLNGQLSSTRSIVKERVIGIVLTEERVQKICSLESMDEARGKMREFFEEFIDFCWLMTISNPMMVVNYDVVGKVYTGAVKERFKQYSCDEPVESEDMEKDCVFEVVWPCVELEEDGSIYAKGDVITVDKGKDN